MSLPFSVKRHGPAVLAWRPLLREELLTGRPYWWVPMYSRDPRINPDEEWDKLMRTCDANELLETLAETEGRKAPGYDGITIDLLKLLASTPDSPTLPFLVSLVTARAEGWRDCHDSKTLTRSAT